MAPSSIPNRTAGVLAWVAVIAILSFGGAGLIVTLDHAQTDAARPELTARGDAIVAPRLNALDPSIASLADSAAALAQHGRDALLHLQGSQLDQVKADLAAGDLALADARAAVESLKQMRATLLDGTSADYINAANQGRIAAVDAAITAADGLADAWGTVADPPVRTATVLGTLAQHDALVIQATGAARASDFSTALARLSDAQTVLATARREADQAAGKGFETSTLVALIGRDADYDAALTMLYTLLRDSGGLMTDDAIAAKVAVDRAQAALPGNNSVLVVIVGDLGGDAMTSGLLAIERARDPINTAADR